MRAKDTEATARTLASGSDSRSLRASITAALRNLPAEAAEQGTVRAEDGKKQVTVRAEDGKNRSQLEQKMEKTGHRAEDGKNRSQLEQKMEKQVTVRAEHDKTGHIQNKR